MVNPQRQGRLYGRGICCSRARAPKLAYRLTQSARSESEAEPLCGSQHGRPLAKMELRASLLWRLSRREKLRLSFSRPQTLIFELREPSTNPQVELLLRLASRMELALSKSSPAWCTLRRRVHSINTP